MHSISVKTKSSYNVLVGNSLLEKSGELIKKVTSSKKAVIVTDDIVHDLYYEKVKESLTSSGIDCEVFVFANGEQSKNHQVLISLYEFLADIHLTRSDILIALGGGVVGDLTGFAAATYLRGVDFVQIPTTLLAQTDSSVGGKTGVNISNGKNLVGSFKQPLLVICDTDTIKTLSQDIYSDGMAEIIKYGVIRSKSLFDKLLAKKDEENLTEIISECIEIKRDIVQNDEFDKGERMLLNFGHTLGHAIERHYNYTGITHGKAVAIGMCLISGFSEKQGITQKGMTDEIVKCLKGYNLPTKIDVPIENLIEYCLNDKKRESSNISIILSEKIGQSSIKKFTVDDFYEFCAVKNLL